MKKILFIIPCLGGGGAERVMLYVMNHLANSNKFKIVLLLIKKEGNTYLGFLSKEIEIINLSFKKRVRYSLFSILKQIKKNNPNICYVGYDYLNIMIAPFILFFPKTKFLVRETNVLSCMNPRLNNRIVKLYYRLFYNNYTQVIAQSDDMRNDLIHNFAIKQNKIIKINNPIDFSLLNRQLNNSELISFDPNFFNLIAVGRLCYQKGYDILLQRLSENKDIKFKLIILGDGTLKTELEHLSKELNLSDSVQFLGYINNPFPYIKASDALILSSRFEGFPNVLIEANALGTPAFSNFCLGGINEIIIQDINGIVSNFNNSSDFRFGLNKLINTSFNKEKIVQLTFERYSFETIMPKYQDVFEQWE
jgi:glycosyltransferase involved in cell wall biosynthesis